MKSRKLFRGIRVKNIILESSEEDGTKLQIFAVNWKGDGITREYLLTPEQTGNVGRILNNHLYHGRVIVDDIVGTYAQGFISIRYNIVYTSIAYGERVR